MHYGSIDSGANIATFVESSFVPFTTARRTIASRARRETMAADSKTATADLLNFAAETRARPANLCVRPIAAVRIARAARGTPIAIHTVR